MSDHGWTDSEATIQDDVVSTQKTVIETEFVSYVEHWFWRHGKTLRKDDPEGEIAPEDMPIMAV